MLYKGSTVSTNNTINIFSNDRKVINFLKSSQFNQEFIPSYSFSEKTVKMPAHSLFVETISEGKEMFKTRKGESRIQASEKNLYLPDITFFLLSLFSRIQLENNSLVMHSCALDYKSKGFLIIGGRGDGKKELALVAAINGAKVASCENSVLCMAKDGHPYVIDGTNLMHVDSSQVLDKEAAEKLRTQDEKQVISAEDFKKLGIKQIKTTKIDYVFYAKILPRSDISVIKPLSWPDNLLRLYGNTATYLSGANNIFISNSRPFPNLDNKRLRQSRLAVAKNICNHTLHFEICGEPQKAIEFMDSLSGSC
ncbi:hypothetical protein COU37_00100 [Candidatus Micrarchaeota archaeon CG10_big_fil_rev_8_21_14_0_10_45_29]|nr:MAG: hypothetical protein COU37_00100 [Candidatus Micrarchaeota archaeon CG10_big_fil_rev_8_21_14_0_10_45_29]